MRILAVNPYGTDVKYSGTSVYLDRLLSYAKSLPGVEITFMHAKRGEPNPGFADKAVVPMNARRFSGYHQLVWFFLCFSHVLILGRRYDVVHIHSAYLFNLGAAVAARLRGLPYVILPTSEGGDLAGHSLRLAMFFRLRSFAISGARVGFALSHGIANEMQTLGLSHSSIVCIPTVVDTELYRPPRPPCEPDPRYGLRTLVFVGTLGDGKRPHLVLEALDILTANCNLSARAIFIGPFKSSSYRHRFLEAVERFNLGNRLELIHHTDNVESVLTERADVFVLPSRREGMPSAFVEAMASGLPVVCTNVGGMGNAIRRSGAGVVISDAAGLARALESIWADGAVWLRYSQNGRNYALANYSLPIVGEVFMTALTGATKASAASGTHE